MPKKSNELSKVAPLILCPRCGRELRLLGIEPVKARRDLFTFECVDCNILEVRGVMV